MKKKLAYISLFSFCFLIVSVLVVQLAAEHMHPSTRQLPTQFSYSQTEVAELKGIDSTSLMTPTNLQKWDQIALKYLTRNNLTHYEGLRVFTYLYTAQRDAAFLSFNTHDQFEGSLDPISNEILKLFFQDYARPTDYISDPLSEKIVSVVLPKYKARFEKENAQTKAFRVTDDMARKKETNYTTGTDVGKWIPWVINPATDFYPPKPPGTNDPEWQKQISEIKLSQKNLSEKQVQAIQFWAGLKGRGSGDWRKILNDYLFENDVPFGKMLLVRSMLMMGLYDSSIVYLGSKYYYLVTRPQVKDPSVTYLITHPNHPSYPSGHSTASTTASIILSYYFPENAKQWKQLAEEAGMSRIWAGIHYPLDHKAGKDAGKKIGEAFVEEGQAQSS